MGSNSIKEYSIFPNGELIRNDRLIELLEVVYGLLGTYDGMTVLYLLLFKIKFQKMSPKYPRNLKIQDYRSYLQNELGFLTLKGSIPKDVKNLLLYLDEGNSLLQRIHFKITEGRKFSSKLVISLDQYDPKLKKVFPSKDSWKLRTDNDFRKSLGESNWKYLNGIGGADGNDE